MPGAERPREGHEQHGFGAVRRTADGGEWLDLGTMTPWLVTTKARTRESLLSDPPLAVASPVARYIAVKVSWGPTVETVEEAEEGGADGG